MKQGPVEFSSGHTAGGEDATDKSMERHYSPEEVADLWRLSPKTIRRLFRREPGIIEFGNIGTLKKRRYQHVGVTVMQSAKSKPAPRAIEFPAGVVRPEIGPDARQTSERGSEERLLTPQEVADRLGVSQRWVRDHATRRTPRITAVKLGSLLRFRWADVEDFLARHILQDPSKKELGGV